MADNADLLSGVHAGRGLPEVCNGCANTSVIEGMGLAAEAGDSAAVCDNQHARFGILLKSGAMAAIKESRKAGANTVTPAGSPFG